MKHSSQSVFSAIHRFVLLGGLSLAATSFGKNLYVDPAGRDGDPGTLSAPFATIGKAAASSAAGETILIRGGTYNLIAQIEPKSGTSAASRIVYKAYPGETVLVNGGTGYCATLASRSYITFENLRFTTSSTSVGAGMFYFENSKHIAFQGCEFFGMPKESGAENSAVIRCMSTGWPDAANVENSDSCVFRNNYFHDNASPAFRLYDTKGWIIENNKFLNCSHAVGGKDEPYDILIRRNLIIGGGLAFYFAMQGGGNGVTITENIVVGTEGGFNIGGLGTYNQKRRNVKVYNNTFYNVRSWIFGWTDPDFDTTIGFWNNIVHSDVAADIPGGEDVGSRFVCFNKYQKTPMRPSQYSMDYNDYKMPDNDKSAWFIDGRETFNGLQEWTAARPSFDVHSLSVDPKFVSTVDSNFHLQQSSPCKGKGKAGEDLGAYPRGNDGTVIGPLPGTGPVARVLGLYQTHSAKSGGPLFRIDGRPTKPMSSASGLVVGRGREPSIELAH